MPGPRDPLSTSGPGLGPQDSQVYHQKHKHSGSAGDGEKIKATHINWFSAIITGQGPILTETGGRKFRVGVTIDERTNNPYLTLTEIT